MSNDNEPNKGRFPASQEGQKPSWTLLQVEDNPANASLVEELISRRSELKIFTATKGHQGIEMARSSRPDVILLDINLGDINGFDVLRILAKDPATAHIPVIAVSSDAHPSQVTDGLAAGFFRYLTKPYRIEVFMAIIDHALEHVKRSKSAKSK
jgi:CheY-like chemotaxis protein